MKNKLIKLVKGLCESLTASDFDAVKQYSMDTPHYMLNNLITNSQREGYFIELKDEDRDHFILRVENDYGRTFEIKIDKYKLCQDPDATIRDFIQDDEY